MLGTSVVERYFQLGLKYLISSEKKVNLLYCTKYIHGLLQYLH